MEIRGQATADGTWTRRYRGRHTSEIRGYYGGCKGEKLGQRKCEGDESNFNGDRAETVTRTHNMQHASQLKDAGQDMHEIAVMAKILGSLPPKYSTLITAWDSVPLTDQKIGVLLERLIKEENRLNIEGEVTSAFFAVSLSDRKSNKDKRYKKQDSRAESKVECFYCKKKGHMARECYKKQRDKQKEAKKVKENSAFVASVSQGRSNKLPVVPFCKEKVALTSMDAGTIQLTDSGASRYMTYRREWFTDFEPANGELVSPGNN
ncbi:hypothetical protein KM043_018521 [Ampulex compressa]|nr:hypothetical protein KM043_018521 [Ampulex compressa]